MKKVYDSTNIPPFRFWNLIYIINEKKNVESNKTKVKISISIDRKLDEMVNEEFANKSKYIEWLIYQDLKKYNKNKKINKIII